MFKPVLFIDVKAQWSQGHSLSPLEGTHHITSQGSGLTQEGNSPTATDWSAIEEYSYSR